MAGKILGDKEYSFDERLPYYLQLKSILADKIERGDLRPDEKLPSEAEICDEFAVSRTVVRQALRDMEYEGLIFKKKGKGTYVARPKIVESFVQKLSGFHEDMATQQRRTRSLVLRLELVRATSRVAKLLRLRSGSKVVLLRRLRFVEEDPLQLVSSYLPRHLCPKILETDFSDRSLYAFLEEQGLFLARGSRIVEAVRATEEEASLMKVEKGAPLIRIESIGCLEDGTPVEYFEAVHRGDRTRFRVELIRERVHEPKRGPGAESRGAGGGIEVVRAGSRAGSQRRGRPSGERTQRR